MIFAMQIVAQHDVRCCCSVHSKGGIYYATSWNAIHGIVQDNYLICWSLEEKLLKALYTFAGEAKFPSPTYAVCLECDLRDHPGTVTAVTGHTGAVFTLDVTSAQWLSADVAW